MKIFLTTSETASPTLEQQSAAKIAGFLYVFTMATAVFGEMFVRGKLIVAGDAAQTAANIVASEQLFRWGALSDLLTTVGVLVLTWGLYVILRPISQHLAMLAAVMRFIENAIAAACFVNVFLVLRVLTSDAVYLQSFDPEQLQVIARLYIAAQGFGTQVIFVFLGIGSSIFAYLWLKSRYIPKSLSILGIVGSLLLAICGLANIVFPTLTTTLGMAYMVPLGIFEVGLGIWLLVKGIQV